MMIELNQALYETPFALTVCDNDGIIVFMNAKATQVFAKYGGEKLVGKSLFACHPESANQKIRELLASGGTNAYTIEKNGIKKMIYQAPWHKDGIIGGLVELSMELPAEMPHFIRK